MIYAKNGQIINTPDQKIFRLFNGKVLNKEKLKVNIFEFEQIDFGLTDYSTNTILAPKIQEIPSRQLLLCAINLYKNGTTQFPRFHEQLHATTVTNVH